MMNTDDLYRKSRSELLVRDAGIEPAASPPLFFVDDAGFEPATSPPFKLVRVAGFEPATPAM